MSDDEVKIGEEQVANSYATMMNMLMGAWTAQIVSVVTRLNIPDLLKKHGELTARQMVDEHFIDVDAAFLERLLRVHRERMEPGPHALGATPSLWRRSPESSPRRSIHQAHSSSYQ